MEKKRVIRKSMALFLSLVMICSLFIGTGITAYAADITGPITSSVTWNDGDVISGADVIINANTNGYTEDNPLVITVDGDVTLNKAMIIEGPVKFTGGGTLYRADRASRFINSTSSYTVTLEDITFDGGAGENLAATVISINVSTGSKFIINDGAIIKNFRNQTASPFSIAPGASVEMNGGIITNTGALGNMGAIQFSNAAGALRTFTMTGGTLESSHIAIATTGTNNLIELNPKSDISITGKIGSASVDMNMSITPQDGYPIDNVVFDDEEPITGAELGTVYSKAGRTLAASSLEITMASEDEAVDDVDTFEVTSGLSAGTTGGTVSFEGTSTEETESGPTIVANVGDEVTVLPQAANGYYVAQVRMSADGGETYTAIDKIDSKYTFNMPEGAVDIQVDTVPVVWDGTIDVTWYDTESKTFNLEYAAQFAGLAAIVNGIFTTYPTTQDGTYTFGSGVNAIQLPKNFPDYQKYLDGMGVVASDDEDAATKSKLYGEFEATYQLTDTQIDWSNRTDEITKTTRVIGNPDFVVANSSTGTTGGSNMTTSNDYWYGIDQFNDKTVFLTKDLDFGATKLPNGNWDPSSPLFMPVAGQYSMLPGMSHTNGFTKIGSSYNGTLDGNGHMFLNVYCDRYANTEFGDSSTIGIIGRLGVHDSDPVSMYAKNPTVRQVVLESGYIVGRRSIGGIVGKTGKTLRNTGDLDGGSIIEFCINKATVKNTDSKGLGGIVGASWNGGIVQHCANFGRIASTYPNPSGGIVGSNEIPVRNSYNVGTISASSASYAMGIGTNNGGATDITDCYWLTGVSPGGGYYPTNPGALEFGEGKEISTLTAALLNGSGGEIWKEDTTGVNAYNGVNYPVLYFQTSSYDPSTSYTVTVNQPTIGGTMTADKTGGAFAEKVTFSNTPATGYLFDYYTVNGNKVTNPTLLLSDNIVVSVTFRELKELDFEFEDTTDKPYTITATKTGHVKIDGVWTAVEDIPLVSGDKIYENDSLRYTATVKPGVVPENINQAYSGNFTYRTAYLPTTSSGSANPFPVATTLIANVDKLFVTATPSIVAKDWSQIADTSWYDADDKKEAYSISTAAELAGMAKLINDGVTTFADTTITLANDISLVDPENAEATRLWVAAGTSATRSFAGTFDGNGKTIKDILISRTSGNYAGLFGYINGAVVKDLTVDGAIRGYSYTAGIAGYANNSTFSNCINKVAVTASYSYGAGIAAYINGTTVMENCKNEGEVTAIGTSTTATQYYGGIAGYANTGSIIKDCMNTANLQAGYSFGGIVGYLNAATVSDSENTGDLTSIYGGSNFGVGGIAGHATNAASSISGSNNSGEITTTSLSTARNATNAGGIIGFANTNVSITSCFNTGDIYSDNGNTGGIVGQATGALISNCYNRCDITTETGSAGGVVGRVQGPVKLDNVYTTSQVIRKGTSGYLGTIAGYVYQTTSIYTNVHYLDGIEENATAVNGSLPTGHTNATATAQTADNLKALAQTLGDAFTVNASNDGYPILVWQDVTGEAGSGDLDGDGNVTVDEVINLINFISGSMTGAPAKIAAVDMDNDGSLTMVDVVLMLRKIMGL